MSGKRDSNLIWSVKRLERLSAAATASQKRDASGQEGIAYAALDDLGEGVWEAIARIEAAEQEEKEAEKEDG